MQGQLPSAASISSSLLAAVARMFGYRTRAHPVARVVRGGFALFAQNKTAYPGQYLY